MTLTTEQKIERVARQIHQARHGSIYDLGSHPWNVDLATAAVAEMEKIRAEEAAPSKPHQEGLLNSLNG